MRKKWEISDDGEFMYDGEYHSKETVIKILNNLEMQVKTDKALIKGYEREIRKMKEANDMMEERLVEMEALHDALLNDEPPSYHKGKEEAYLRVIDDNIDRITALELEKWYYEMKLEEQITGEDK